MGGAEYEKGAPERYTLLARGMYWQPMTSIISPGLGACMGWVLSSRRRRGRIIGTQRHIVCERAGAGLHPCADGVGERGQAGVSSRFTRVSVCGHGLLSESDDPEVGGLRCGHPARGELFSRTSPVGGWRGAGG